MKHFLTIFGIAGLAIVAVTVTNAMAQTPQTQSAQMVTPIVATMTPVAKQQSGQPVQPQPFQFQQGCGSETRGRMMGNGMACNQTGPNSNTPMSNGFEMMQGYAQMMWQNMNTFWNSMMNGLGHGSNGWGMMWRSWPTPQSTR
jgi:hypothetical protein